VKILIVGSGMAGTLAAKTVRELDPNVDIDIFGEERYPYYPRPNLIEFVAGRLPYERLFAFPENWNARQRIGVRLGLRLVRIRPDERIVESDAGETFAYDALLVASGARAAVPPIEGAGRKGVFVLRTLDDALAILDRLRTHSRVAVLGGGLLGLEIARAIRGRGAEVTVVEFFDRLLPRQLDPAAAAILKGQIEKTGISVRLGAVSREIIGDAEASGIRFESGEGLEANLVVIAAGIKPELGLAKEAGLAVGRGVVVDDRMRTSRPGIFAAGDVAEHQGRIYGIIPASFEQARAAAYNMLGQEMPYGGTVPSNTLKVAGLYVTSAGEVNPEGRGFEAFVKSDPGEGLYKKVVLKEGRLVGAIWMGTKKGAAEISRLVSIKKAPGNRPEDLLEENFDFAGIS
jgi:NAD(P)H-nitrite reductase large subunit